MSDVLADADNMRADYFNALWMDLDRRSDWELQKTRYSIGIQAREGNPYSIECLVIMDQILLTRHTSLCEGCLGRTGCDMCCPPDFSWMNDAYDREGQEEMLGRPLFPNEY